MSELDISMIPSKTMLVIWLKQLVAAGLATFENQSGKVISLSSSTSNGFAIGFFTNNLHPIIAAPENMSPWFQTLDIYKIYTSSEDHGIYIAMGEDEAEFYIKVKSTKDRITVMTPKKNINTDLISMVDIASYKIDDDGFIHLSRTVNRVEVVEISSIDLLIPKQHTDKTYFCGVDETNEDGWLENSPYLSQKDPLPDKYEEIRNKLLGI